MLIVLVRQSQRASGSHLRWHASASVSTSILSESQRASGSHLRWHFTQADLLRAQWESQRASGSHLRWHASSMTTRSQTRCRSERLVRTSVGTTRSARTAAAASGRSDRLVRTSVGTPAYLVCLALWNRSQRASGSHLRWHSCTACCLASIRMSQRASGSHLRWHEPSKLSLTTVPRRSERLVRTSVGTLASINRSSLERVAACVWFAPPLAHWISGIGTWRVDGRSEKRFRTSVGTRTHP